VGVPLAAFTVPSKVNAVPWLNVVAEVGVSVVVAEAKDTLFQLVTSSLASTVPRPLASS